MMNEVVPPNLRNKRMIYHLIYDGVAPPTETAYNILFLQSIAVICCGRTRIRVTNMDLLPTSSISLILYY